MTTVQLRRYTIEQGRMDDFVAWWRSVIGPRAKYGFRVVFAYADDEHGEFVWAVAHDNRGGAQWVRVTLATRTSF